MALLKGKFIKDIYRDFKTGFAIFSLYLGTLPDGKWNTVLVKSQDTIEYRPKTPLVIEGYYEGNSFIASSITECASNDSDIVQYLVSAGCPGIGERTAERIAMAMPDFFSEISQPNAVQKLQSCGVKDAELVVSILNKDNSQAELIHYLKAHGGTYHQAMKLYDKHAGESLKMLQKFPYQIADEIGLALDTADSIAKEQGETTLADSARVNHLINIVANKLFDQEGNTFVDSKRFVACVQKCSGAVFNDPVPTLAIEMGLCNSKTVKAEKSLVFSRKLERAEKTIATEIRRLLSVNEESEVDWQVVSEIEKENHFQYASQQRWAFTLVAKPGIGILTGGPGTGKTTTVDGLIRYFEKQYLKKNGHKPIIKLCAPTGRAAQRIKEQTKREASTIHQLLEFKPFGNTEVCKGKDNPIQADLIIIDEMSMTDVMLFSMFLNAVQTGTTIVLVGDVNQLASVGPGNVLKDLISSRRIFTVMLTDVYRQAADSNIISNANKINNADIHLQTGADFEILYTGSDAETAQCIQNELTKYYKATDKYFVQLLCPTHKGIAGVDAANKTLQSAINPETQYFVYGNKKFFIGDKIIMMKNKFAKGYCNGDVGEITSILTGAKKGVTVKIGDEEIAVTGESLDDMELSYAMTIHKSQGSEYPVTIVAMTDSSPIMLKRNLLYTAVTRAKKKVIVIDERGAMEDAIVTPSNGTRQTALANKLMSV